MSAPTVRNYRHIGNVDVEDATLRLAGAKPKTTEATDPLAPQRCPRCKAGNAPTAAVCATKGCGYILDPGMASRLEEDRNAEVARAVEASLGRILSKAAAEDPSKARAVVEALAAAQKRGKVLSAVEDGEDVILEVG